MRTPNPWHVAGFLLGLGIAWACIDAGMRDPGITRPAPISQGLAQD
jgi:hypothetical protein